MRYDRTGRTVVAPSTLQTTQRASSGRADEAPCSCEAVPSCSCGEFVEEVCRRLLGWFELFRRDLPWRRTRDPYHVWISEVMLQQTRVETVIPYYNRFLEIFPHVEALAQASLDTLLKAWEGLGYYARARNFWRAARQVAEAGGMLPDTVEGLLRLPGIGRYTAGAIASIAFGVRAPAVDGNVERVLARLYAEEGRAWTRAARLVMVTPDPSLHSQALMELGATVCTPRQPLCSACPVQGLCAAFRTGTVQAHPEPHPSRKVPTRTVGAGLVLWEEHLLVTRRPSDGLLGGLWDLPSEQRSSGEKLSATVRRAVGGLTGLDVKVGPEQAKVTHSFTHFHMRLHAFECRLADGVAPPHGTDAMENESVRWVTAGELDELAFPVATRKVLRLVFAPGGQMSGFEEAGTVER